MARKIDNSGNSIPIVVCPKHGEYYADDPTLPFSYCPSCEDDEDEASEEYISLESKGGFMPKLVHIQCRKGESIYECIDRAIEEGILPNGAYPIVKGPGHPFPEAPGMLGTVQVRPRECFVILPKPE